MKTVRTPNFNREDTPNEAPSHDYSTGRCRCGPVIHVAGVVAVLVAHAVLVSSAIA